MRARGRGAKRKLTWLPATFATTDIAASSLNTFVIATAGDLQTLTLGRGTVGPIYGTIKIGFREAVTQGTGSLGAYGIRLMESDATPVAVSAFSPSADGDSSDWITWRNFSLLKQSGAGTGGGGDPLSFINHELLIRNPRKIDTDEKLVLIVENSSGTATITVMPVLRVGILLP